MSVDVISGQQTYRVQIELTAFELGILYGCVLAGKTEVEIALREKLMLQAQAIIFRSPSGS